MGTKEKAADAAQQEGDRAEGVEMSEGGGGGGGVLHMMTMIMAVKPVIGVRTKMRKQLRVQKS